MSRQRMTAALLAVAAACALAACGDDDGGGDSAAAGGSGSASESKENVKLAMELILTGVQFGQDIKGGIEAYAREDGAVDVEIQGPPSVDPVTAQKQATDMLAKGPDAMGVAPFPPELWPRTLKTISDQVDAALTFNIKPTGKVEDVGSSPIKTFVGISDAQAARDVTVKTIELAKLPPSTTGYVLLGQCVPGNTGPLYERIQGFKEVLGEQLPKAEIIVFDSKVEPQANTNAWTAQLAAKPDPVLVLGTCDQDGTSLYKIKKAKRYRFPVGALELPPETVAGIKDGSILASSATHWYLEGYASARLLAETIRGGELPEGFIDVGTTMVTKENIDEIVERNSSVAATDEWYAPKVKELFDNLAAHTHPIEDAWK
jgi:ABC-type sugar transport system substrate-binding protein